MGGAGGGGGIGGAGGASTSIQLTANWHRVLGGNNGQVFSASVATDQSANVIVAATVSGTVDFGGGALAGNANDVVVASYDVAGTHRWSKRFGNAETQLAAAVAADANGNAIVVGSFIGTINFGGGNLSATGNQFTDVFIAKLDSNGNHVWSMRFGDITAQEGHAVAVFPNGQVVIAGTFQNSIDFGGGPLTTAGDFDVFLVKLDATGNHVFSQRFGDSALQSALAVATESGGRIALGGVSGGSVNFGGGLLMGTGTPLAFLAVFDSGGTHQWSSLYAGGESAVAAVAFSAGAQPVAAGRFKTSIDLGGGPLMAQGANDDVFVGRFATNGTLIDGRRFGDSGSQRADAVAVTSAGEPVMAGRFTGTMVVDDVTMPSAGGFDGFVVRLGSQGHGYRSFGDALFQAATAVAVDGAGRMLVTGDFSGNIDVGTGIFAGDQDAFVVSYAP